MFGIGKMLSKLDNLLRRTEKQDELLSGIHTEQEKMTAGLNRAAEAVSQHDRVIEDMLDAWEEIREEQETQISRLQTSLMDETKQRAEEAIRREETLLKTLTDFYDQLFTLQQAAAQTQNEAWEKQIGLMLAQQSEKLALSGIQVIGRPGDGFSYQLHEAMQVLETDDRDQDLRIADVICCGYLYHGKIIRKARTAVWRFRGDGEETK